MAEETAEQLETVKYYTRARKFPQLLGRMPDGTKIPGGPYTVQQLMAGILVLVVGGMTIGFWGIFGGIGNVVALFGLAFATVFVIGRIPLNGRNPLFALTGLFRAMMAPPSGRFKGRPIRFRRPRRVTHLTVIHLDSLPGVEPAMARTPARPKTADLPQTLKVRIATRPSHPTPTPEVVEKPVPSSTPLSGVQALLALAAGEDHSGSASAPAGERDKAVRR